MFIIDFSPGEVDEDVEGDCERLQVDFYLFMIDFGRFSFFSWIIVV